MKIDIPFADRMICLNVPDENVLDIIEPVDVPQKNEKDELKQALSHPINSDAMEAFISKANDLLIIVNDAQRPICTPKALDLIWDSLNIKKCKFIVATGSHKEPSDKELNQIFGNYYNKIRNDISIHKSKLDTDMIHLGTTSKGTIVKLNRILFEYDKIVTITTVEPHNFAGYTGGRKSIVPGIASYETIEHNHRLALEKGAENLVLKDNPVSKDMYEALGLIAEKQIFSIQIVLDKYKRIYKAFCGNIDGALLAATKAADKIYSIRVMKRADIIVAVPFPPLDANLYQAHKAIENAKPILEENGILILTAACHEGIGQDTFYKLLQQYNDHDLMLEKFKNSYRLGEHKSAKIARLQKRAEIWAVTNMKPEILKAIRFRPLASLQSAIDEAIFIKGKNAKITFLLDGGITVPQLKT